MELIEITLLVGVVFFAAVLGYESNKLKKIFWEITLVLVEVALYVGAIFFAVISGYESNKSKRVFLEMQAKVENRLKERALTQRQIYPDYA
jgi:hypothetical protein